VNTGAQRYFAEREANSLHYHDALQVARSAIADEPFIDSSTWLRRSEALKAITESATQMRLIVTVKLPKNPDHNPHNKVTGPCPLDASRRKICTDVTGEHHSELVYLSSIEEAMRLYKENGFHVTRIEEV
jgi:hypothetical protein